VTDTSLLGGGYAESLPDPGPTVEAVLRAARSGAPEAHLAILCGPPGVGKSAAAAGLIARHPGAFFLDKDTTAAGFVLQAARDQGVPPSQAYGTAHYRRLLRPLEYAGPLAQACANLVGARLVLLVGGWGPELTVPRLWNGLRDKVAPARFTVVHFEPPPLETWRERMAARGSRRDSPWFEAFARAMASLPVWEGAVRVRTDQPLSAVVQRLLELLA
jgi:hypothetical protein